MGRRSCVASRRVFFLLCLVFWILYSFLEFGFLFFWDSSFLLIVFPIVCFLLASLAPSDPPFLHLVRLDSRFPLVRSPCLPIYFLSSFHKTHTQPPKYLATPEYAFP